MAENRVDEILGEVKSEIERRRKSGYYSAGYEESIENDHNLQLGKMLGAEARSREKLTQTLEELRKEVSRLSEIEVDASRFRLQRFVREVAMSRHQLRRMNREMRHIVLVVEKLASEIVDSETERLTSGERVAQNLLSIVDERSLVMEKMILMCQEMEARLRTLEGR